MTMTRRAFGIGLIAASALATGGYFYLKDTKYLRQPKPLTGFVGGEKRGFLANPATIAALRGDGFELNARQAGSVEMVREAQILRQDPDFLWPSSSVMVEIAKENSVPIRRAEVILNSPIVVYSWEPVVAGLEAAGLVRRQADGTRTIDLALYLKAVLAGRSWSELGVGDLSGPVRIVSTDPNLSNSGFMFAGLVANLLAGEVTQQSQLRALSGDIGALFHHMGFKSNSSGSLFEDYIAGGPGVYPMAVLYENQLIEWALEDGARWQRVMAGSAKPVLLYPAPTVYSAHPLISLKPAADALIGTLLSPALQEIAWSSHGFRGPLGSPGAAAGAGQPTIPEKLTAIVPMPEAKVMLDILQLLS
ncbi:hypothetical protein [Aestuariivirga sp.]|uniref:hypothetical protein n=1 Tax=Aestuariivirga sp. TaxID=2650926 RepID=UPI003015C1D3